MLDTVPFSVGENVPTNFLAIHKAGHHGGDEIGSIGGHVGLWPRNPAADSSR